MIFTSVLNRSLSFLTISNLDKALALSFTVEKTLVVKLIIFFERDLLFTPSILFSIAVSLNFEVSSDFCLYNSILSFFFYF